MTSQLPDPLALFRENSVPQKLRSTAGALYRRLAGTLLGWLAGFAFSIAAVFTWGHFGLREIIWILAVAAWCGIAGLICAWPTRWGVYLGLGCFWLAIGLEFHFALIEWRFSMFSIFTRSPITLFLIGSFLLKWLYTMPVALALRWITDQQAEDHELPWNSWRRLRSPLFLILFGIVVGIWMPSL